MNSRDEYFKSKNFIEDPFASTNALQEKYLEKCFVVPPYYYSLVGSVRNPKSSLVTAPRGTGKTAQRVMLEKLAEKQDGMLAVVYDDFPIESCSNTCNIRLEDHLERIMKALLISFLTEVSRRGLVGMLDGYEKKQLRFLIELYLTGINSAEIDNTIRKIKGVGGKLEEIWCKTGKSITSIINAILSKADIGQIDLEMQKSKKKVNVADIKSHYDFMEKLFNSVGISAVYILVDSIDETVLTGNNAEKSYYLIRPFILDLRFLERETIVFKFFIWDKIKEFWGEDYRGDRIEHFEIKWTQDQIEKLICERIKVYSNYRYSEPNQILNCSRKVIEYIYYFANNFPRDAINIMKSIFDEHLRNMKNISSWPDEQTVIQGIEQFCKNKFDELVPSEKQKNALRRIKLATFTIPYLYNDIFKCESSTARNMLMPWTQSGIVLSSNNKIKVKRSKNAINVYTFSDIRVARLVCSNERLEEFIERNMCICPECHQVNVFDKYNSYGIGRWQCKNCLAELLEAKIEGEQRQISTRKGEKEIEGQISLWEL